TNIYTFKIYKPTLLESTFDSQGKSALGEVDEYLLLEEINWKDDLFLWWKHNKNRFPVLSELATKYLCVPATSTP
ncbi:8097_t:CDS:2, partial [Entrophospora sp. SA101]